LQQCFAALLRAIRPLDLRYSLDSPALSPNGLAVAFLNGDGYLCDVATGRELARFEEACGSKPWKLRFSPDGGTLLTTGIPCRGGPCPMLWSTRDGTKLGELKPSEKEAQVEGYDERAEFSPDGRRIVGFGSIGTVRVWDVKECRKLITIPAQQNRITTAEFSRDGRALLTASDDGTVKLWDAATGRERAELKGTEAQGQRTLTC
jgi:WD40 repeat protein